MAAGRCMAALAGAVMLAATCLAAIPGPNDRRYPDVIVDPPVRCSKVGVFPHPRNCTWYYRCVDRMNIGYLWTYYFECEPGTVFSDDLDQCVFPHMVRPPCGTAGQDAITPTPWQRPPTTPSTTPSTTHSTTPSTTTTLSTTTTQPGVQVPCLFRPEYCLTYPPCPPSTLPRTLCSKCFWGQGATMVDACNSGDMLFDIDQRRCVLDPFYDPNCPDITTIPPTTTTPITTESPSFTVPCQFHTADCKEYPACPPDNQPRTLCSNCYIGSTSIDVCPKQGMLLDRWKKICVDDPKDDPFCPDTTTTSTTSTTTPSTTTTGIVTIQCQFRPGDCLEYPPCPPSTQTRTLCSACYVGSVNYNVCPRQDMLLNPWTNQCVDHPKC